MAGNKNLHAAKEAKKDEFYTQMQDIAGELRHYAPHFRGKTVLCNCDDPYESNFAKYFYLRFNDFGLRKLICTSYKGSPIAQLELSFGDDYVSEDGEVEHVAHKLEVTEARDWNGDGAIDLRDFEEQLRRHPPTPLTGEGGNYAAGDFRSPECVELLREADIVVTNPPFSLFREYVAQLMAYDKKFLIIGNQNAITYKEIFPLIKENKLWVGVKSGDMSFTVPEYYEEKAVRFWIDENGQKWRSMGNICWFTNLDHNKRHEPLDLYKRYTPEEYPRYDNYDAIEVSKTANIPADYTGVMGVPITFLDKYCPEQFEIVKFRKGDDEKDLVYTINGKTESPYFRILIRKIK